MDKTLLFRVNKRSSSVSREEMTSFVSDKDEEVSPILAPQQNMTNVLLLTSRKSFHGIAQI